MKDNILNQNEVTSKSHCMVNPVTKNPATKNPAAKNGATNSNVAVYTPERARLSVAHTLQLHSDDENYVENALARIGITLDMICVDKNWHKDAVLERLDTRYYPNDSSVSRVRNYPGKTDKRMISAGQLLELRRVAGISIDRLADGGNPFEFERMTDTRLVELMEQISAELSKRSRKNVR